jgi:hypothetical protein
MALRPQDPAALLAGAAATELAASVRSYSAAADLYLRAELARGDITDLTNLPATVADLLIEAYEADPAFAPARGPLYAIAAKNPTLAEQILPRMLARTPDERRVHEAWLRHLQAINDRARFEQALQTAQARFPQASPPPSPPQP